MIRLCIKKSIFVFFFLFLFYAYQSCGVSPFPVGRCLDNALFVTSALMLADGLVFVGLFVIDTACTLWLWREPYSPVRTLGYSLVVALVFALLDHLFDPFARSRKN